MSDRIHSSFPTGPPSPSSPAAGSLKESRQLPISSEHIPQTPTSPPLMSVSDQSHVSNFASTQASPNQAIPHPNTSSPPSSTPMSTQVSQQPTMSTTNSFPTPASSVSGQLNATSAEDPDHKSFSPRMQDSKNMEEQQVTEHTRTDHDRQPPTNETGASVRDFATDPGQQVTDTDAMDVDKDSAPRFDARSLGLDSLQTDFTSAFHLCKSCKNPLSLITAAAR